MVAPMRTAHVHEQTRFASFPSPVGELLATLDAKDRISGLRFADVGGPRGPAGAWIRDERAFAALREQLDAYFAGSLERFQLPVAMDGSPFQCAVWRALQRIPYGQTASYAQVADAVGKPGAARAVGNANGSNPIAIIVPCHRVIASDGTLGGYGGGLDRKRWLLERERAPWQEI